MTSGPVGEIIMSNAQPDVACIGALMQDGSKLARLREARIEKLWALRTRHMCYVQGFRF